MENKFAVCIGINDYPGADSDLHGCVNDALDWSSTLEGRGFDCELLLDSQATGEKIRSCLFNLAQKAKSDDLVVITFSGHGSFVPDEDGDEDDGFDECWCPYDIVENGPIVDDELHEIFSSRANGVRWVLISDSCHSGTMSRFSPIKTPATIESYQAPQRLVRFLAPEVFSKKLGRLSKKRGQELHHCSPPGRTGSLLLSGCQDYEYSYDAWFEGRPNGAFTFVALRALEELPSDATYEIWYDFIRDSLPSQQYPQSPNIFGSRTMQKWVVFASASQDEVPKPVSPKGFDEDRADNSKQLGKILARNAMSRRGPLRKSQTRGRRIPIVAEGDSWFKLPLSSDVIDCLESRHNMDVRSVAQPGHTIQSMATEAQFEELVREIDKLVDDERPPKAILLSGGGNDLTGNILDQLLNHAQSQGPILKGPLLDAFVNDVVFESYTTIIAGVTEICRDRLDKKIPIIIHGYSYAVPDGRGFERFFITWSGPWLQPSFMRKGYREIENMQPAIDTLIDRLNTMQKDMVRMDGFDHVRHIDLRDVFPRHGDHTKTWQDELHLRKSGYEEVARRFAGSILR